MLGGWKPMDIHLRFAASMFVLGGSIAQRGAFIAVHAPR